MTNWSLKKLQDQWKAAHPVLALLDQISHKAQVKSMIQVSVEMVSRRQVFKGNAGHGVKSRVFVPIMVNFPPPALNKAGEDELTTTALTRQPQTSCFFNRLVTL